ncbi:arsenate reductase (glutaredoxin) [Moheibacter sediminis]|uniref:Arsenate reductase n=1 Tax=Moheibacter sediminis TaxID=1434700 RepID=A0A1W1ZA22_9FLAO|nr:arsenate reductase (glutaredoxin) [Moheibacter sediminis]SMC45279.1 arsenate reductase [Moheibacter sediminis]
MIKIYHNPRCSKSREGLSILEESGKEFEIIDYMKTHVSENELNELIKKLNINPIDLVRKNEEIWKQNFKDKKLTDKKIVKAMADNPKLIERPIVMNENKAVIGRPPVLIKDIL